MRFPDFLRTGLLVAGISLALPVRLHAQLAGAPFSAWPGELLEEGGALRPLAERHISLLPVRQHATTRSHTKTGLLIGGLVGAAATTVFLIGFCSDPDTACGADEVGRAVVLIGVPCAAVGALIGSLVRTQE